MTGTTMERHASLLLDVWREVCRHIEIGESIERLGPILMRRLPIDTILVRRLEPARSYIETVASGSRSTTVAKGMPVPASLRTELSTGDLDRLLEWCGRGKVYQGTDKAVR